MTTPSSLFIDLNQMQFFDFISGLSRKGATYPTQPYGAHDGASLQKEISPWLTVPRGAIGEN